MIQQLTCTKCDEIMLQIDNQVDQAVCDIFAYHHIQHVRKEIAKKIMDKHDTTVPTGCCFDVGCQVVMCTCEEDAKIALGEV